MITLEMGASQSNKNYINNNWDKLKCSPIGPFLQMIGLAPGNISNTSSQCKSSEFSSQFNSSMTNQLNVTKNLTKGMGMINGTLDSFRKVIGSIQQRAFEDISKIAKIIFSLYVKIGGIIFVMIKHIVNIIKIFKSVNNVGASLGILMIAFINLIRDPFNKLVSLMRFFRRLR
jgi:hypothetical protein